MNETVKSQDIVMDTININEKEYKIADLTNEAKYAIDQIRSVRSKMANIRFELDQLAAAEKMFEQVLQAELAKINQ